MRKSLHNPKYTTRIGNVSGDAVILKRADFKRTKQESIYHTAEQQMEITQQSDEQRKKQLEEITAKRQQLLDAEEERKRRREYQATKNQMQQTQHALDVAEAKEDEELDEVKAFNTEMMCARARTVRDMQLAEKKKLLEKKKEQEREEARMLEEGRLRALEIYKQREEMLKEQRRKGGDVLVAQIEEKKINAKFERERRQKEMEEMQRANEAAKQEETELFTEKKRRKAEFLSDCMTANALSLLRKQREKERDIEEAQMMVEYQAEKAAKEDAYEREIAGGKALKEKEIAEVRKLQQRAIDTQAQRDEVNARRVQEEKERRERQKEIEELRKKQEVREQMQRDRFQSIKLKEKRILEMAKIEQAEFERMQEEQRRVREQARIEEEKKKQRNEEYRNTLKTDLEMREEDRRLAPLRDLDESKHLKEVNEDYVERLERIRARKIAQLEAEGVPEKYIADLRSKRVVVK